MNTPSLSFALLQIPVFQRGGSVVPIKTTIGKSTGWMTDSPYGLRVALSTKVFGKCYLYTFHVLLFLPLHSGSLLSVWLYVSGEPHLWDRCFRCLSRNQSFVSFLNHCLACLTCLELFLKELWELEVMDISSRTLWPLVLCSLALIPLDWKVTGA